MSVQGDKTKRTAMNNLDDSQMLAVRLPAHIFHTWTEPPINTGALARWKDAHSTWELFQQFVRTSRKPLKRPIRRATSPHRAKAPVLMRIFRRPEHRHQPLTGA